MKRYSTNKFQDNKKFAATATRSSHRNTPRISCGGYQL